jgi:hypothetical protein
MSPSESELNRSTPQFGTAEYIGSPGGEACHSCQRLIANQYYRLNGAMACRECAEKALTAVPQQNHADFIRGLLYATAAAVAGLILYAAFEIATGIIIGYLSLAVGWMVGKAMMKGSNGHGGRRYQITAALLTYAAVSMAAIPIWIHYASSHRQHSSQQQQLAEEQREFEQESGRRSDAPAPARPSSPSGKALLTLAFLGLASPFLELSSPVHGLIGLFILSIGIRIAWQTTGQKLPALDGPFESPPRPPAAITAG